jgi:hypothetical protein
MASRQRVPNGTPGTMRWTSSLSQSGMLTVTFILPPMVVRAPGWSLVWRVPVAVVFAVVYLVLIAADVVQVWWRRRRRSRAARRRGCRKSSG